MDEPENKMTPVNFTVDLERQVKLRSAATVTGIGRSELIRYMIDRLESELGNLHDPDPKALRRLTDYCNGRGITKGTARRGRKPLRAGPGGD